MSGRRSFAHVAAAARTAERLDVLALVDEMIAGVPALRAKYAAAGQGGEIDFNLFADRLRALRSTIESGCHVGEGAVR